MEGTAHSPNTSSQAVQGRVASIDASRSAQDRSTNVHVPPSASDGSTKRRPHGPSAPQRRRKTSVAPPKLDSAWSTKPPAQSQSATKSARTLARKEHARRGRERRRAPTSERKSKRPRTQTARTPSAASSRSEQSAKEARTRVQAVADLCSVARGHQVSIMDVVLDAQASAAGGGLDEDLLDALEERQRIAMHGLSDEDAVLEMLSPRWYGVRQARKWQGTLVPPVDCSSSRIYHISAERSTASWDGNLDSDDGASSLDSYGTAPQ
ncbi:hypothetical protein EIP86_011386 [Pleurotus ostreatoroseus]|nr:hypothetical protein EIP86_011386 [Pleurotus ostreatoroseus]